VHYDRDLVFFGGPYQVSVTFFSANGLSSRSTAVQPEDDTCLEWGHPEWSGTAVRYARYCPDIP